MDKTEEDSAINKEIEKTTDFKEYFQECIVMIDLAIKKGEVEKPDAATGNQNTSPPVQNNQSESQASKEASIKLPKIQTEKLDKCLTSLREQAGNCRSWALLHLSMGVC